MILVSDYAGLRHDYASIFTYTNPMSYNIALILAAMLFFRIFQEEITR